jgi:hypothetical protein
VHGVFLSCCGDSESSPRLQFRRARGRDSAQVVTPFVQVGTSCDPTVSRGIDYTFTWSKRIEYFATDILSLAGRIHLHRDFDDLAQPVFVEMSSFMNQLTYATKSIAISLFRRHQRVRSKVR